MTPHLPTWISASQWPADVEVHTIERLGPLWLASVGPIGGRPTAVCVTGPWRVVRHLVGADQ